MKLIFIAIISLATSCANNENALQQNDELIESDTAQNDTIINTEQTKKTDSATSSSLQKEGERKLRYLFYANGGLVGYFDDGTVAACPRCDLLKENIRALHAAMPFKKYTVEKDGSLLVGKSEHQFPKEKDDNGNKEWAMIDYKWLVNL